MKRRLALFGLFLSIFFISVVAHLPARFALSFLPEQRDVAINNASGTIWNGSFSEVILPRWQRSLGSVSWQFQPFKLFSGKLEFLLRFGQGSDDQIEGRGKAGVGFSGLYAQDIIASLPADKVMQQLALPVPVSLEGRFELLVKEYHFADPWCSMADGSLVWSGGQIQTPVGPFTAEQLVLPVICEQNHLTVQGNYQDNQLTGALNGSLTASSMRYDISTWFTPGSAFPEPLKDTLKWLGKPDNQGRYSFEYSGKLQ